MLKFTFEDLPSTVLSSEASLMVEGLRHRIGDLTTVEPERFSDWDGGIDLEWEIDGGRIAAMIKKDGAVKFRAAFSGSITKTISFDSFIARIPQAGTLS